MDHLPEWAKYILATLLGMAAGWLAYLQQFINPSQRPPWDWLTFSIKGLTAGFVGLLTQLLLVRSGVDPTYGAFLVAVAGWSGAETIVIFQEIFRGAIARAAANSENKTPKG